MAAEVQAAAQQQHGGRSKPKLRRQLQGDWVELESAEGEVYYANVATKETSWDLPLAALAEQDAEKENEPGETGTMSPAGKLGSKHDSRWGVAWAADVRFLQTHAT